MRSIRAIAAVRKQCCKARRSIKGADMNTEDRTLQDVMGSHFGGRTGFLRTTPIWSEWIV